MKSAPSIFLAAVAALLIFSKANAGEATVHTTQSKYTHTVVETRSCATRHSCCPFSFLGRVAETFLQAPRIFAEGIEGDRALVNERGILAPREVPPEDCILSGN